MKIGFIGLGIMGKPMAKNLVKAGYELVVSDKFAKAAVEELLACGATAAETNAEVAAQADILITMVPNSPDVKAALFGENGAAEGLKPGSVVLDCSSINPVASREISEELAKKGVEMMDAPVSGGEPKAIDGTLAFMVGGKPEIFEKVKPILEKMGSSVVLCGGIGAGNVTKLCNQIVVAGNIAAVAEAMTLGQQCGVEPEKIFEAIKGGLAGSTVMNAKAPMMMDQNFKPGFRINLHIKDLNNVVDAAAKFDSPIPLTQTVLEMMKILRRDGDEACDHSALVKYYQKLTGDKLHHQDERLSPCAKRRRQGVKRGERLEGTRGAIGSGGGFCVIFDCHVHTAGRPQTPNDYLTRLNEAGIDKTILLSFAPASFGQIPAAGKPPTPREALRDVMDWARESDRIIPFFWIDPIDEDAADQVDRAVEAGIAGFKVICGRHYPGDERALKIYERIAAADKPMLFHSGILYSGSPSSQYNRPAYFEPLFFIPKLRFALAHVSWPWHDECLAVYGHWSDCREKGLTTAEMFVDTTPGTPPIYREEVLRKIYTIGYDIEDNVIFGTDCSNDYRSDDARRILAMDKKALDSIGVTSGQREKYYHKNLLRFLGQ